ncbi:unnamed protein product [Brassica napus]|uniref:(rape) hypothetical protein n=1 Tax=Brassica napus TaxID=3708 RepID=A0A816KBS5_BRANA|nr:unnamed protein product [Brassica napus]
MLLMKQNRSRGCLHFIDVVLLSTNEFEIKPVARFMLDFQVRTSYKESNHIVHVYWFSKLEEFLWEAEMVKIKAQDLKGKEVRASQYCTIVTYKFAIRTTIYPIKTAQIE